MADRDTMTRGVVELGFVIKGYPGSGRRVEAEGNLSRIYGPDLLQGAFMGDAILKVDDVDFGTNFGWVTLIDWCLRLTGTVASLEGTASKYFLFSESDDFMSFRRYGESVLVASSYQPGIGVVRYGAFASSVRDFVDGQLNWISLNFPDAMKNPAMADVCTRIASPFPA